MKRILAATDLSEPSYRALERARLMAVRQGASLRILHATPEPLEAEEAVFIEDALTDRVGGSSAAPGAAAGDVTIRIRTGHPAATILDEARLCGADLIVVGNRGEPGVRDALFGNTATHIVQHARVPVLIVQTDPERPYRKLMAAVDEDALDLVLRGAASIETAEDIYVVHAQMPTLQSVFAGENVMAELRHEHDHRVRAILAEARPKTTALRVHCITEDADAVDMIMKEWEEIGPDLVVIGTHGRTGVGKLIQPSVAETVLLGCPSDVLVIPAAR